MTIQTKKKYSRNTRLYVNSQPIWEEYITHWTQCLEYTKRREWLSAYYYLQLACLCGKHYIDSIKNLKINAHEDKPLPPPPPDPHAWIPSKDQPVESLRMMYAMVPKYQEKVKTFQQAFGCPPSNDTSTIMSDTRDDDELDCKDITHIDLSSHSPVTFQHIVGQTLAKRTIEEGLLHPVFLPSLYPKTTKAILFYGPPGTGKTLMARATANELNREPQFLRVLFFAPSADQFKGKYVGETEAKIVHLFQCASQQATTLQRSLSESSSSSLVQVRSVIFIDEIDSLARNRENGGNAVASATGTLLQVMDGMKAYENVVVMGATNYPWNLDAAVLRRFPQKVYMPLPDEDTIVQLLQAQLVQRVLHSLGESFRKYVRETRPIPTQELFYRFMVLHGLQDKHLRVLAKEMTTTSKQAGYSPRDITKLCTIAFKDESSKSIQNNIFYSVVWKSSLKESLLDHVVHALHDKWLSESTFKHMQHAFSDHILRFSTHRLSGQIDHEVQLVLIENGKENIYNRNTSQDTLLHTPTYSIFHHATLSTQYIIMIKQQVYVNGETHLLILYGLGSYTKQEQDHMDSHKSNKWWKHVNKLLVFFDRSYFTLSAPVFRKPYPVESETVRVVSTTQSWLNGWKDYLLGGAPATTDTHRIVDHVVGEYVSNSLTHETLTNITTTLQIEHKQPKVAHKRAIPKCVHMTYSPQTFLDAYHKVPPSSTLKNIKALEKYT